MIESKLELLYDTFRPHEMKMDGTYSSTSVPNPEQKIARSLEPCSKISEELASTISSSNPLRGNSIQGLGLPADTTTIGSMRTSYHLAIYSKSGESGPALGDDKEDGRKCSCVIILISIERILVLQGFTLYTLII